MQSRAFIRRSPQVCRVVRTNPTSSSAHSRNMSLFSPTPFLVRGAAYPSHSFASLEREVAPLFRIMDDLNRTFENHFLAPTANVRAAQPSAPFQPRFDVREVNGGYELRGELPGVESKNVDIQFTDAQTLVIRGRTESEISSGTPAADKNTDAVETSEPVTATSNAVADDATSTHSTSSYQKASVEDEAAESVSTPGQATPPESIISEAPPTAQINTQTTAPESTSTANGNSANSNTVANADTSAQAPQYWVTERRTGSFQRVFTFPGKINQEGATATLRNGVLNVLVPKALVQQPRRINVL